MRLSEVAKAAALSRAEHEELVARKKRAQRFAQVGGTLGLAALATRAPQGVKVAAKRSKKLSDIPTVRRVVAAEPRATSASNTLTTLGAGIGAAGSFNFAGMQRREAKAEEKAIRKGLVSGATKWAGRKLDDRAMRAARDLAPVGARLSNGATVSGHEIRNRSFGMRSVRTTLARDGRGIGHVDTEMLPTKRLYVAGMGVDAAERGKGVGTSALHMLERNAPKAKSVRSVTWTAVGSKKATGGGDAMHGAYAWRHGDARYLPGVGIPRTASAKGKLSELSPAQQRAARRYILRSKVGLQRPGDLVSGRAPDGLDPRSAETLRGMAWWGGVKGGDRSHPVLGTAAVAGGGAVVHNRRDRVAKARNDRVTLSWVLRNQDAMDDFTFSARDFNFGSSLGGQSTGPKPAPKAPAKPAPKPAYTGPVAPPLRHEPFPDPQPAPAKARGRLRRVPKKVAVPALSVAAVTGGAYGVKRVRDDRVGKRDDRFLRQYRERISPDAERGYTYLRDARSLRRTNAGVSGAVAGLSAASIVPAMALNSGKRRAVYVAGNAALAGVSGYSAVRDARAAHRLTGRMRKIEARAKQRALDGQYGVGRGREQTDPTSRAKVGKAAPNVLSAVKQPVFRMRPKSYGVRSGGLVRLRDGRQVTRRGSVPGTGDFAR